MKVANAFVNWVWRFWPGQRAVRIAIGFVLIGLWTPANAQPRVVPVWQKIDDNCPKNELSTQTLQCITVKVNSGVLAQSFDLLLELPDQTVQASRVEVRRASKRVSIWHGIVKGKTHSKITFAFGNDAVIGTMAIDGKMYSLRSIGNDVRIVELLDPQAIPTDAGAVRGQPRVIPRGGPRVLSLAEPPALPQAEPPALPPPLGGAQLLGVEPPCYEGNSYECANPPDACWTDSPHRIDIMVLYTDAARMAAGDDKIGDDSEMNLWIALNIDETNSSYIESNAVQRIRLAHSQAVQYEESGSVSEARKTLTLQCDEDDDELNVVHGLRDEFNADVVVLVTHISGRPSTTGQAKTMQEGHVGNYVFEPCAFVVVQASQFRAPDYVFAHELGHVMGGEHDKASATGHGAVPESSFGYVDKSGAKDTTTGVTCLPSMTIMAQRASCGLLCQRLNLWSNPTLMTECQKPLGGASQNNRDTLNRTALTVANFRCESPVPNNVWMKDVWDDIGDEPNPVAEPMSRSPYIWIRNAPDTSSRKEQHQHQNPVTGQTNHIYIKVHNSADVTITGTLQVRVGKASSSPSWPSGFVQVGSRDFSFARKSTQILEFPWTPTENGRFCLVARWDSESDPMTTPETSSVDANVRGNNNIVWLNVNVVDGAASMTENLQGEAQSATCS